MISTMKKIFNMLFLTTGLLKPVVYILAGGTIDFIFSLLAYPKTYYFVGLILILMGLFTFGYSIIVSNKKD